MTAARGRGRVALHVQDRPVGLGRRSVAGLVDVLVAAVGGGGVLALELARSPAVTSATIGTAVTIGSAAVLTAVLLAQWLVHGRLGWTVGRWVLGVRTVDAVDRAPIGPWRVLLRGLVVLAAGVVPVLGPLVVLCSPLLDRTGRLRGWHDRAAGAEVLRTVPRGRTSLVPGTPAVRRGPEPAHPGTSASSASMRVPPAFTGSGAVVATSAGSADLPVWAGGTASGGTGVLQLAALSPQRAGADVDTHALPVQRPASMQRPAPVLAYGLAPELEVTHRATRPEGPGPTPTAPPETSSPPATPSTPRVSLELDDGSRVEVRGTALLGRNPAALVPIQLVRVVDPRRSVSKTHVQVGVDEHGVWVADRGSTNGTVVHLPDGGAVACATDRQLRLTPGAVVVFGDRSLRVVPDAAQDVPDARA